jgi:predicted enzyme related to lactoylglutathione lyase
VALEVLFAGVPVRDFSAATEWYRQFFGKEPDVIAHDHEVLWKLTDSGWLYVVQDGDRAGRSLVAISVPDLDAAITELQSRGLSASSITREGDAARKATFEDPDGNSIALIEVAS